MYKTALALLALFACKSVESYNILVVCPFFGKSHSAFIHPIVRGLASKGHDLTVITTNLIQDAPANVKQIQPNLQGSPIAMDPSHLYTLDAKPSFMQLLFVWSLMIDGSERLMNSSSIKTFIREDKSKFDLVMVELFFHEAFYALAHKYQAPLVLMGTGSYWGTVDKFMGNPSAASYLPHEFSRHYVDMTLMQRVNSYVLNLLEWTVYQYWHVPKHNAMIQKYFASVKQPLPTVQELERKISLVMFNTHYSMDAPRHLPPGVIEVAGIHLKPPKKLPEDLQKFLDEAKDGFIYFSLGSNLRSSALPKETVEEIVRVFSRLKQRVLWKWEDDNLPPLSDNVKISKWLPQPDVLAHPNIKLFITQTGMLSTQETIDRGVPVIGIPVFGDQHINIAKIAAIGMGLNLPYSELGEASLSKAIDEILNNPKYMKMAKEVSGRFKDRPTSAIDSVVFWTEYVIRHKGAEFMKPRLVDTPWYQYHNLDVFAVIFAVIIVDYLILKLLCKCICGSKKTKQAKHKRN